MKNAVLNIKNAECIKEHFRGANAVYHGFTYQADSDDRVYTAEQTAIEYDRLERMELKIARTFFCHDYAYQNGVWNWESDQMKAFYRWLGDMQKRNIQIALSADWWFSEHVFLQHNGPFTFDTAQKCVDGFAAYISELLHQLIEVRGFSHIRYLFMLTEPNDGLYKINQRFYFDDFTEPYGMCVRAVHNRLIADGRRQYVKLCGPNAGLAPKVFPEMLYWCKKHLAEELDVFTSHCYLNMDYSDQPSWEAMEGKYSLRFRIPGFRAQQYVPLEPHCEYEATLYAKVDTENLSVLKGGFLFGGFCRPYADTGAYQLIHGGGEGISYLTENSVRIVDASELTNEWKKFTMRFSSGENTYGYFGIFHDVKNTDVYGYYDHCSLKKVGDDREILRNGDFEDTQSIDWLVYVEHEDNKQGVGGTPNPLAEYDFWHGCAKHYMECIPAGKEFWFDEYNTLLLWDNNRYESGISFALAQAAFINAGVDSSLLWALFDQQWPNSHADGFDTFVDGDHRCGIMPSLRRSLTPYRRYYAFTAMSKYLGDGDAKIIPGATSDTAVVSMVEGSDGHLALLVVNCAKEEQNLTLQFQKAIGRTFYRHLYAEDTLVPDDKAEILPRDKELTVADTLQDTLPAFSMAVYTTRND